MKGLPVEGRVTIVVKRVIFHAIVLTQRLILAHQQRQNQNCRHERHRLCHHRERQRHSLPQDRLRIARKQSATNAVEGAIWRASARQQYNRTRTRLDLLVIGVVEVNTQSRLVPLLQPVRRLNEKKCEEMRI